MNLTSFQRPEIRDSNDNIIQTGTYGKNSPLVNAQNTGAFDYINNNLMALQNGKLDSSSLPAQFDSNLSQKIIVKSVGIPSVSIPANGVGSGTYTYHSEITGKTPKAIIAHAYSNVNYYPVGVYNITDTNCTIKFRNLTGSVINSTVYVRLFFYL